MFYQCRPWLSVRLSFSLLIVRAVTGRPIQGSSQLHDSSSYLVAKGRGRASSRIAVGVREAQRRCREAMRSHRKSFGEPGLKGQFLCPRGLFKKPGEAAQSVRRDSGRLLTWARVRVTLTLKFLYGFLHCFTKQYVLFIENLKTDNRRKSDTQNSDSQRQTLGSFWRAHHRALSFPLKNILFLVTHRLLEYVLVRKILTTQIKLESPSPLRSHGFSLLKGILVCAITHCLKFIHAGWYCKPGQKPMSQEVSRGRT